MPSSSGDVEAQGTPKLKIFLSAMLLLVTSKGLLASLVDQGDIDCGLDQVRIQRRVLRPDL
jgi:hypothetical protein